MYVVVVCGYTDALSGVVHLSLPYYTGFSLLGNGSLPIFCLKRERKTERVLRCFREKVQNFGSAKSTLEKCFQRVLMFSSFSTAKGEMFELWKTQKAGTLPSNDEDAFVRLHLSRRRRVHLFGDDS